MQYSIALDLQKRMCEIVRRLGLAHVDCNRVVCFRSVGSKTKRVIARCHALPKIMQLAMEVKAWYAIEFLERFERLTEADQDMTIIHELMHIPKTFGGGFRHHDFVSRRNVEKMYKTFLQSRAAS
ncbi:MAG: metallopeptidase [Proteobacteria bacterium]|nr:metallopeptidase [Pseudomonadota bacterium]